MNITLQRAAQMVLLVAVAGASLGLAASREDELKQRFKQRYPQLQTLKQDGTVGETYLGYVEFVKDKPDDESAVELVDAENKDRRELYELIAQREGTTREKVADRNAKRVFEKARPGEYLKGADGRWTKKAAKS